MEDVSDAVREMGEDVTVTRTAAAAMVSGYAVAGAVTTFTTTAVDYPVDGDELLRLPEGLRSKGVRGLICDKALRTADAGPPDTVDLEGVTYEVHRSKPWRMGNFFECLLVRR